MRSHRKDSSIPHSSGTKQSYPGRTPEYAEIRARTLLSYASTDPDFGAALATLVEAVFGAEKGSLDAFPSETPSAARIMPADPPRALRHAQWLVGRLRADTLPGGPATISLLRRWAGSYLNDHPQRLIIGVVGETVPGIGLGLIAVAPESLRIIIREDIARAAPLKIPALAGEATLGLLASALAIAGGDAASLEPDILDWFAGERHLEFYAADATEMRRIERQLSEWGIMRETVERGGAPAALAISPVLRTPPHDLRWDILPLAGVTTQSKR